MFKNNFYKKNINTPILLYDCYISQAEYSMAACSGSDIDWQCMRCRPAPLHQFVSDVSTFASPADSTHLSDLPVVLSPPDLSSESVMDITVSSADLTADNSADLANLTADNSADLAADNSANLTTDNSANLTDATLALFHQPEFFAEESIDDSLPHDAVAVDQPEVDVFIIPSSSNHGKDMLADNLGFSYTIKEIKGSTTKWRCTVHNKHVKCRATIHQVGNIFMKGPQPHLHPVQPGIQQHSSNQEADQVHSSL